MIETDIELLKGIANQLRIHSITATTAAGSRASDFVLLGGGCRGRVVLQPDALRREESALLQQRPLHSLEGSRRAAALCRVAENGFIPVSELATLRQFTSELEGHPTPRLAFADVATGSLGQGLGVGAGIALAGRLDKLDYNTYVLLGDGEIAEGAVWEAASLAGYYKLNNLIAIVDANRLGQSDPTAFGHDVGVYAKRFEAFGWRVETIDGHDIEEIIEVLNGVGLDDKPLVIIAKPTKARAFHFCRTKKAGMANR